MSTKKSDNGGAAGTGDLKEATKPAAKTKAAGKKDLSPAEILASPDASTSERIKAAKVFGQLDTEEALVALLGQVGTPDEKLSKVLGTELTRVVTVRGVARKTFDPLPMFEAYLREAKESPVPEEHVAKPAFDPVAVGAHAFIKLLHRDERPEVFAAFRAVAWTSPRGYASLRARSLLAHGGDPESVERMSWMLCHPTQREDHAAAHALLQLPQDVGPQRAKAQLDTASPEAYDAAVRSLFAHLQMPGSLTFDARAWWDVIGEHLLKDRILTKSIDAWREKHGIA